MYALTGRERKVPDTKQAFTDFVNANTKELAEEEVNELYKRFSFHPPRHSGIAAKHEDYRHACLMMGAIIYTLIPRGREQALALTHLEEVMMWGNAGIARDQT